VVAAVVPARDESAVIERSLSSLRRIDYPGRFFIVLIDDGSRDGTAALAADVAAGPGHPVDIVTGKPLPEGWTGKLWAMAQGRQRIDGVLPEARYAWFTDADVEHDPQALRDLVWQAESQGLDLVSNMALLHCASFWERLLITALVFYFRKLYPFRQVNTPRHSVAAAGGGSMLVRLETLQQAGRFERIRGELIDDCALARILKACGKIWLGLTIHSRSIRPYSFADIWRMGGAERLHTTEVFHLLACGCGLRHDSHLSCARDRGDGRLSIRQLFRRCAGRNGLDPHVFSVSSHDPILPSARLGGLAAACGCPALYADDVGLRQAPLAWERRRMEKQDPAR